MNNKADIDAEQIAPTVDQSKSGADKEAHLDSRILTFWKKIGPTLSKVIYRIDRIFGDLVAISLGLGIAALWMACSVLDRQSTDLTVLRPNFKIWFAEAFQGQDAEFGQLELAWQPADDRIVVTIEDAEVRGSDGEVLERFDLVKTTLELGDEFSTLPRLVNARIKGGVLSYYENAEGEIVAGLGPPEAIGRIGPVYRSGKTSQSSGDFRSVLQRLEFVQIEDVELYVRNETSGLDLKSDIELLRANLSKEGDLAVTAIGSVNQKTKPMPFSVNVISDSEIQNIKLRADVKGARLDDIGPKKGRFWELQGLSAPVNLTADIDFSRLEGLRSASVEVEVGSGNLELLRDDISQNLPFENLTARASLEPGNDRMEVESLNLQSPNLSFESSGFLTELGNLSDGDENSSPIFDLSFRNIKCDLTPIFPTEANIKGLNIIGQADVDSRKLEISSGRLDIFDSVHNFSSTFQLNPNNSVKTLLFNSAMSGTVTPSQFLSLWPVNSFPGARGWIEGAILEADIGLVEAEIAFDEAFFETRTLTEDRLKFRFGGEDVTVKYMKTLPPATGASGVGEIIGNVLKASINDGQVGDIDLIGGSVLIPRLRPLHGDIIVTANTRGTVSDLLHLADHPPYQIASRYNVDPNLMSGEGNADITVRRALIPFLPQDQIEFNINGQFTGVNAPFDLGKYKILNGNVTLDANRQRAMISGPVEIGPWNADISWLETFGENAPPTQYTASGIIDANLLDELGFASRTLFDGNAALRIDAVGQGRDISGGTLDVDLTNSELSLDRIWVKPEGEPARLSGQLTRGSDNSYIIENALLNGTGINVGGRISFEPDYKLRQIDLSKMSIPSLIDGAVKITPDRLAGRLGVELDADYLNVSSWTEDLFAERKSNLDVPLFMNGTVRNLILAEDYPVTNSELYFSHTGDVVETASLEALSGGEPVLLELKTREDFKRQFDLTVPDASKAVSAFMGLDNTKGGRLSVTANLPAAGEEGAYVGEAQMRDFKLIEAPALAQLLSLASLTGLADTLTNGSMQFDRFKVPFAILGDDIAIRDARLYGPAIGMTGNGDIKLDQRSVDFDGTLVPAYTANSILGDIPVLGDIFVQEKDGGLFALTYTVTGPFEQTQISVNPLSALTPGFLRGIFKRDRSEVDDAMREAIEDVTPKEVEE